MKTLIIAVLLFIVAALGSGGLFMLRKRNDASSGPDKRMARALALRVGLSVLLFLLVLLAAAAGWIRPTGIPTGS